MKKLAVSLAFALFAGILLTQGPHSYYVATTGDDITGNGSSGSPWRTTQKGVDTAQPGDTVQLGSGSFTPFASARNGNVGSRITVIGQSDGSTTITGAGTASTSTSAIYISHAYISVFNVNLSGCQIYFGGANSHDNIVDGMVSPASVLSTSTGAWVGVVYQGYSNEVANIDFTHWKSNGAWNFTGLTSSHNNIIHDCKAHDGDGWDVIRAFGHDQTIRHNEIVSISCTTLHCGNHTDVIQTFGDQSGVPGSANIAYNIIFEQNYIHDSDCQEATLQAYNNPSVTIMSGSAGQSLPQSIIHVSSTVGWSSPKGVAVITTSMGQQVIPYFGVGSNPADPTLTGCIGGRGSMSLGATAYQDASTGFAIGTTITAASDGQSVPGTTPVDINVASETDVINTGKCTLITQDFSQHVLSCVINVKAAAVSIVSGGSGYTVGDILNISGGTFASRAQLKVLTVSSGAVATVSINTPGVYMTKPANPVSVTGGFGTGAQFNVTSWAQISSPTALPNCTSDGTGTIHQGDIVVSFGQIYPNHPNPDVRDWVFRNNLLWKARNYWDFGIPGIEFYNNTIVDSPISNQLTLGSGGGGFDSVGSKVKNNLFSRCGTANTNGIIGNNFSSIFGAERDYNYASGANDAPKSATYFSEPNGINGGDVKFVNLSGGDFHLQSISPAIGAGVNLHLLFPNDRDGISRPTTGAWDAGAYVYSLISGSKIISLSGDLNFGNVVIGQNISRTITDTNTGDTTRTDTSVSGFTSELTGVLSGFPNFTATGYTVASGGSRSIVVTVNATAGPHTGTLTFNGDQTGGVNTIPFSYTGVAQSASGRRWRDGFNTRGSLIRRP